MLPDGEGSDEDVVLQHVPRDARHGPRVHLHPVDESGAGFQLEQKSFELFQKIRESESLEGNMKKCRLAAQITLC